jgi:chromosome segregation ATPase
MSKNNGKGQGQGHAEGTTAPLGAAAGALEHELRRFEELAASLKRAPLTSQKAIERAAQTVSEAAACQGRLGELLRALVQAIEEARLRQEASAVSINERGDEIRARGERLGELLTSYSELGEEARGINAAAQEAAALQSREDEESVHATHARLAAVDDRMAHLADRAHDLQRAAEADDFPEVARQAESMRQQMLSVRNRMKLLREKLPPPRLA